MTTYELIAKTAETKYALASAGTEQKDRALLAMADAIEAATEEILACNREDIEASRSKYSDVMIDRLMLDPERIRGMADGIRQVVELPDPAGQILRTVTRPNGLVIQKVSAPMGVIAIIYESRPNVTSVAAALSLKAGSACILRSGKEAWKTSNAIVEAMKRGLKEAGLPEDSINLIQDTSRESGKVLMTAEGLVDLLIPRGGKGLKKAIAEQATVPTIQTGDGVCHVYVDATADQEMALNIIENAKTSRPSVCNAEEQLLVHQDIAAEFLPKLAARLRDDRSAQGQIPVELRIDAKAAEYIDGTAATEEDFDREFLDYILGVRVVDSVEEAIRNIDLHSTHHSECIVSQDPASIDLFTLKVDAAAVYVNASTRFTDGGEFGLGCEMGISTQKLHARGPMGLEELCTYKYVIRGTGQTR